MEKDNDDVVKLNVGGVLYETYRSTLVSRPDTLLGTMFSSQNRPLQTPAQNNAYFFDRNPRTFALILDYYRTGKLTLQSSVDKDTIGLAELRQELDFFQIPESSWSPTILTGLHVNAAARISHFVDSLFDLIAVHMDHFIDIVVVHFARGEDCDSASLRNVNRSVEHACVHVLDRLSCGFRLLSDEKLATLVRETILARFPTLKATVQMVRHELLVLCLSGYLDVDQLRTGLGLH
jgi:hypothetical protein